MFYSAALPYAEQETLTCATCGVSLDAAQAHYGHPLITARQLVTTGMQAALRSPKLLGELMLQELPAVPYCAACRQQLPVKRQAEQMKFMLGVLLIITLLVIALVGAAMFV